MKKTALSLILFVCFGLLLSFTADDYEQWYQKRMEGLKNEDGWLNLAGLYWLNEGENTLGSDAANALVFPQKAPKKLGILTLKDGKVAFKKQQGVEVQFLNQENVPDFVFQEGKTMTLQYGSFRWFVIKRGPKYGVRLRDLESPNVAHFKGVERFPVNEVWKLTGTFEQPKTPRTIAITDVIGLVSQQPLVGYVIFTLNGKTHRLAATDGGDGQLFIVFKDTTAGHETYGAGRFLYLGKPSADNSVIVDFNKAINPPCAFTEYATCPLPPNENRLPIAITAGEKNYGMH
jgi:uncharacterized protein (DUF1684 family)